MLEHYYDTFNHHMYYFVLLLVFMKVLINTVKVLFGGYIMLTNLTTFAIRKLVQFSNLQANSSSGFAFTGEFQSVTHHTLAFDYFNE